MGRVAQKRECAEIIRILAERYPDAFFTVPYRVVPLTEDIAGEIFFNLGKIPDDFKRKIRRAIFWYKEWPSYLQSVAFGERRRNLQGHCLERHSLSERELARSKLKERGLWTKRMDMVFNVSMGRKEAANS